LCVSHIHTHVHARLHTPVQGSNKMQLGMQVVQQEPNMEGEGWNEVSDEAKEVIRYTHIHTHL